MSTKLCVNCRHSTADYWGLKCGHPEVPLKDLGNGERDYASRVRHYGKCGKDGEMFELKPPKVSWLTRKAWEWRRWLERRA